MRVAPRGEGTTGLLLAVASTDEQRARGVIAASAGNHSQGLSYHGTRLGVPVTIVMPRTTPSVKIMQTEAVGGSTEVRTVLSINGALVLILGIFPGGLMALCAQAVSTLGK